MFLLFIKNLTSDFGCWVALHFFPLKKKVGNHGLKGLVLFDASFYVIQQCVIHICFCYVLITKEHVATQEQCLFRPVQL